MRIIRVFTYITQILKCHFGLCTLDFVLCPCIFTCPILIFVFLINLKISYYS